MRCAIIRRPVKYLCPRTIDLRAVKMKIADDILERGVQAALGPIGSDDGRLWRSTFTSGRVWQSVSVATSTRRSRDREGFRARVPAQEPIGLQTYGQRFRGGLRRLSIADIASRVTASGPTRRESGGGSSRPGGAPTVRSPAAGNESDRS